ncbi:uncharacterized protein LOC142644069 [Castanea sativa]|uniref:uncharacterized protein LOC142644069 n=1 Tax=Castanea sativa TaxID=21020 RepID=UPI003F64A29B
MRNEVDELKSAMKDKGRENLDGIILRTDSPFTNEVLNRPLPPKLCLPQLESYDGSKDPLDHIESFKTLMLLQMTLDEVMCRALPTTLKGVAREWINKIPPGTIADFEQLSKGFQAEGESPRQYVTRFNKELLQVDEAEDQVLLTTFQAKLLLGDLFFSITKSPPKIVAELLCQAQKYMNVEDVVLAKEMKGKRKRDKGINNNRDKKKETRSSGQTIGKKKELSDRKPKFTLLIKPIEQDHRHRTDECRHLKDLVETLIWQGKLQKYIRKTEPYKYQRKDDQNRTSKIGDPKPLVEEIKTILGGITTGGMLKSPKKAQGRVINSVHSRLLPMKMPRNGEPDIIFVERDSHSIRQSHDDPLVIMLRVEEFNIHQVLIDNGSSVDIVYLSTFQQMKLEKKRIRPFTSPLVSFTGDKFIPRGIVTLIVITGTYPAQVTKEIDFLIVDCPSTYNIILGRLALNRLRAAMSTYYLKVKFPTAHGVGEIRGDQVLARECYQATLASRKNYTWVINEPEPILEPSKTPQEVEIVLGDSTKILKIGTTPPTPEKEKMISFLRANQDVFVWKHKDMPRIDRKIIPHRLNVNSKYKPVQQK